MAIQNFKQIIRSLWKYKSFTAINLLGLSIGIASAILIFMIADYENGFDKLHKDSNNIYRVVTKLNRNGKEEYDAKVPYPLARFLRNETNNKTKWDQMDNNTRYYLIHSRSHRMILSTRLNCLIKL